MGELEQSARLRLRRTNSTSRAENILTEDAKVRRSQPDKPIHSHRDSLISQSSGFQNYEGLVNWAFLLLFLAGVRLVLENITKYGLRVNLTTWVGLIWTPLTGDWAHFPTLYMILYLNVPLLFTLLLEKLIARDLVSWRHGCMLHMVNLFLLLLTPILVINVKSEQVTVAGGTFVMLSYTALFFKMWSYVQVNHWCRCSVTILEGRTRLARHQSIYRQNSLNKEKLLFKAPSPSAPDLSPFENVKNLPMRERLLSTGGQTISSTQTSKAVTWPANLNLKDIYYFWFTPTLCYELNFPRTSRIRLSFLLRRFLEFVIGCNLAMAIVQQWMVPSVVNSLQSFAILDPVKATERLLKLALPNHLLWLTFFYVMFHVNGNILGELLRFADRDFYHDWWNASNIAKFWGLWNLPVHRWVVRHLYKPMLQAGQSKTTAVLTVFFTSAFFHEYLISVPLRMFKLWSFLGMMGQVPLFPISLWVDKKLGPRAGNALVWVSLIVGQPMGVMMYYHDYVVDHFGSEEIQAFGRLESYVNTTTVLGG